MPGISVCPHSFPFIFAATQMMISRTKVCFTHSRAPVLLTAQLLFCARAVLHSSYFLLRELRILASLLAFVLSEIPIKQKDPMYNREKGAFPLPVIHESHSLRFARCLHRCVDKSRFRANYSLTKSSVFVIAFYYRSISSGGCQWILCTNYRT